MQTYCAKCNATVEEPTEGKCRTCGAERPRWGWPEDPRLGEYVVGKQYRVVRRVGAGGFGVVYEVRTAVGDLRRALKVLSGEWSDDADTAERFVNEALVLERVNHPNVGRCYAAGRLDDEGALYLLLEFVEGRGLGEMIAEGPISPELAVPIARQVASGLVAAHASGVLHRDLKPDNILIVGGDELDRRVKLVDFGIAKEMEGGETVTMRVVGTPQYMAPEQLTPGIAIDARVDLWQLGATLYAMLTGQPPYRLRDETSGKTMLEMHAVHMAAGPRPSALNPKLARHERLDQLVSRLLASDPTRRPASAAEVCEALARIEHGLTPEQPHTSSLALLDTLCAQPGPSAWWSLCRFIHTRDDDRSLLIGMAEQRLSAWPRRLRIGALRWWELVRSGEPHALWTLVRHLDLSARPLDAERVRQLAESAAGEKLERLDLSRTGLDDDGLARLVRSGNLRNLVELDLRHNRIGPAGITALVTSPHLGRLVELRLDGNPLGPDAAIALAGSPLQLLALSLADTGLGPEGAAALASGAALRGLRRLELAGNALGVEGARALASTESFADLAEIDLSRNGLDAAAVAALCGAPWIAHVRRLSLAQNRLANAGLERFATALRSEMLEELDVSSNRVDASGAMVVASNAFARRLESLELADNALDDAGVVLLLRAAYLGGLQHLGLAQNALTGAGVRLLTGAPPRLESIDLSRNKLGSPGAAALASALPATRITGLGLADCGVGGDGIAEILGAGKGRIRRLDISHNGLGADGLESVAAAPELAAVSELDVSSNELRQRGAGRLATSPFARGLRRLVLANNAMGDRGLQRFCQGVENLAALESLDLTDNRITAAGVAPLAAVAPRLTELTLSLNELGDAGAEGLTRVASWHGLQRLRLSGCRIGFAGLATLLSAPSLPVMCHLDLTRNALTGEVDLHSLGPQRIERLQEMFAAVAAQGSDVAARFYELLFERHPAIKPLFAHVTMSAQRRHLNAALNLAIDSLRDPDALAETLTALGMRHAGYGVAITHYFAVTDTLLDVLKEFLGDRWSSEMHDAWYDGLDAISGAMIQGHRAAMRTEVDALDTA